MRTFHEIMYQDITSEMYRGIVLPQKLSEFDPQLNLLWHIENVLVDPKQVKR